MMNCNHENDVSQYNSSNIMHIIQLQSNTKDDHVTIHGSSPKAGPEVTNNKSFLKESGGQTLHNSRVTHAWYKLKSSFFLETLSRASSPIDMSH